MRRRFAAGGMAKGFHAIGSGRGGLMRRRFAAGKRRGSLAVESAIFLPLFIVGILTIGYLLRFAAVEEGVLHVMTDEARRISAVPIQPTFEGDLRERVLHEGRGEIGDAAVGPFLNMAAGLGAGTGKGGSQGFSPKLYTGLVGYSVAFDVPLRIPQIFVKSIGGEKTVLCRAFIGADNSGDAMPFSKMEEDGDGKRVWVFPRAGTKYHGEGCRYIDNDPRETLLCSAVRRRYSPCELCHPDSAQNGALVYCFPTSGHAYHLGSCTVVERYVIEIGEEDAKKQGYTPCSVCGGIAKTS